MTRLENVKKAGFFALPEELPQMIASYVAPAEDSGRIIDPCAGKGVALVEFARLFNLEPYGIEINDERAKEAGDRVDDYLLKLLNNGVDVEDRRHMLNGSFSAVRTRHGAFQVNYNNPPYLFADDKEVGRVEFQFLRDTRAYLQEDGILIWVVPQHMLKHLKAAKFLHTWYDDLTIRRFPDELYSDFKQVVVFGRKRKHSAIVDKEAVAATRELGRIGFELEPMTLQDTPLYNIPKPELSRDDFRFRTWQVNPKEAIAEAVKRGVSSTREFQSLFSPEAEATFSPLTPMKIGHLVGIIAAGHLNNQVLAQGDERILMKGHSIKTKVKSERTEQKEKGYVRKTMYTDKVMTHITYFTPDGKTVTLEGNDLEGFMGKWIEQLTKTVSETYQPRYTFKLGKFAPTLRRLNLKRTLPFYGKPGLLPAQMHVAAAMATHLTDHESGIIVGTMGTGKTVMATAVAAALHNHVRDTSHVIVLCPPHLVSKWIREIKVTWPKAKAMALNKIKDVDEFFAADGPIFGVMKETTARSASGWAHSYEYMGPASAKPRGPRDGMTFYKQSDLSVPVGKNPETTDPHFYSKLKYLQKIRPICCPTCGHNIMIKGEKDIPAVPTSFKRAKMTCEKCNSPLYQDDRRRTPNMVMHGFKKYARRERRWRKGHKPLPSNGNNGSAKYPLASYIFRKYKGKNKLLIADEVHQYKAADSDRGYAFHRLVSASERTVALTGTIYGGKASTLFDLMYRISGEVREAFTDKNKSGKRRLMRTNWVDRYGILQEISTQSYDEHGKMNGNSKDRTVIKELPGASPSMLPWILNMSVFINLEDMGVALPPYEEIPIGVQMSGEMQVRYDRFKATLTEILRNYLIHDNKSLLGAYLQSLLTWPDSPWRNKAVERPGDPDTILARIEGINMPLGSAPKERAIIDQILEEKVNGRKTLLLCQQTSTLDITPQWEEMLKDHGIKTAVLRNTPPDKREAWIKKQVDAGVDVVITHPKKVETGLDLLDFPTEIWMGIEYSIYTVLQASRRAWRLGQDKPVKVYFYVYENTIQASAIKMIAAKVGAALRVNGDTIPNDSLAELDEYAQTDMVNALTEILMKEADYEAEMKELNAAYEAAKNGFLDYSAKYSFVDTNGDKKAIRKKWAAWSKELHPDVHQQDEAEGKDFNDLKSAFQSAAEEHDLEGSYIGDFAMDEVEEDEPVPGRYHKVSKVRVRSYPYFDEVMWLVEDDLGQQALSATEEWQNICYPITPKSDTKWVELPEDSPLSYTVRAENKKPDPYSALEIERQAKIREEKKQQKQSEFITQVATFEELENIFDVAGMMLTIMAPFTNPGEARDEFMTYKHNKIRDFNRKLIWQMYEAGYSDEEVATFDVYLAPAEKMVDWILAKEEAQLELDGELFDDRFHEMKVLATAVWHEVKADVKQEPIPELEPEPKPTKVKVKRLEFGVTDPSAFRKKRKTTRVHEMQMSLFG